MNLDPNLRLLQTIPDSNKLSPNKALWMFRDPCCPRKHYRGWEECWHAESNPCHAHAPSRQRECELRRSNNRDFESIALNHWNMSCACQREGYEWNSKLRMCVGKVQKHTGCCNWQHSYIYVYTHVYRVFP
jgi:hypothetical protein